MRYSSNTVSIVVPAYNEQDHIAACLTALLDQSVPADEIIVVDNNSKDNTAAIVREQFPTVRLLSEKRQGVVFARNSGFDAAKGTIMGRIDADTIVSHDWVKSLHEIFADSDTDATSGAVEYYDMPARNFGAKIDLLLRRRLARKLEGDVFLFGANMALRKSAWKKVRGKVCTAAGMHEDFDIAIHMQLLKLKVTFDERLWAGVSSRRVDSSIKDFYHYVIISPRTYAQHNLTIQRHMYPVLWLVLIYHLPLRIIKRMYDAKTESFSLAGLFSSKNSGRIDPTTHQA